MDHLAGNELHRPRRDGAYNSYVALRDTTVRATQPYDFVISPTSPILPYEAELPRPTTIAQRAAAHRLHRAVQHVEQPAASLNWTSARTDCRSASRSSGGASTTWVS